MSEEYTLNSVDKIKEMFEKQKDSDAKVIANLFGVPLICNKAMQKNSWMIICGEDLYSKIQDIKSTRVEEG